MAIYVPIYSDPLTGRPRRPTPCELQVQFMLDDFGYAAMRSGAFAKWLRTKTHVYALDAQPRRLKRHRLDLCPRCPYGNLKHTRAKRCRDCAADRRKGLKLGPRNKAQRKRK